MLRALFIAFVLIHGLIHLMGFAKAFHLAALTQLTQPISKGQGVLWLAATILFATTALLFLLKNDAWWMAASIALLLSQYLIIAVWPDAKFGTIANVVLLIAAFIGYSTWNYSNSYKAEVNTGLRQTAAIPESLLTEADVLPLPEPVRRYLRYAGVVGKPKVTNFKVEFVGQIRQNEQSAWMPFTSEQYNFMDASTRLFFMKATMKNLPVAGFHCFKNGDAFMDIRLLSLFKVQYQTGKEMGISETVTFFNDMCCMAPATLIDKRIQWLTVEGDKVKAAFTNNGITITAWLYFNDRGELVNFISTDRFATGVNNTMQQFPWSTPLKDYKLVNGYKLPGYAEVIYSYPEGNFCYGNFQVVGIEYNSTVLK